MAPKKVTRSSSTKKVTRSSSTKKVASKKKEQKKGVLLTKTGVLPMMSFGKHKITPAAAVSGDQAGSSTSVSVSPTHQPRLKSMSVTEAASLIVQTPTSSDVEIDLSQSSTQSTHEETLQISGQQPQPLSTIIAGPPEVGAVQEIKIPAEEGEQATLSEDPLSSRSTTRKRRVGPTSSSPPSDLDATWKPPAQSESEARHVPRLRKRKVPESLGVMEEYVEEEEEDDEPVIMNITPAPVEMETDIIITPTQIAGRDVARIPPTQQTSTLPPASIFAFAKARQRPSSSSTPTSVGSGTVSAHSQIPHPPSSSSGFESGTSSSARKFTSPVWDFFSVSSKEENVAICSICRQAVSRGKFGTNYGTGGQTGHLKKHHTIQWEAHLLSVQKSKTALVVGGEEEVEKDMIAVEGEQERVLSSPAPSSVVVPPTSSATSPWHCSKSPAETPRQQCTALKNSASLSLTGFNSSASAAPQREIIQPSMLRLEGQYERNHPTARLYNAKLTKMLELDHLPLSFVEGVGFLQFVSGICPKWKVPSRSYFARALHHNVLE